MDGIHQDPWEANHEVEKEVEEIPPAYVVRVEGDWGAVL